jgi:hypothetical protein
MEFIREGIAAIFVLAALSGACTLPKLFGPDWASKLGKLISSSFRK